MIKEHEKMMLPDENGSHEVYAEVNWNPKDERTNECKVIRLTFPNGDTSYVKREYFLSFLFAFSKEEDQARMVPVEKQEVRYIETVVGITATKDIAKGEKIVTPISLPVPIGKEHTLAGASTADKPDIKIAT